MAAIACWTLLLRCEQILQILLSMKYLSSVLSTSTEIKFYICIQEGLCKNIKYIHAIKSNIFDYQ